MPFRAIHPEGFKRQKTLLWEIHPEQHLNIYSRDLPGTTIIRFKKLKNEVPRDTPGTTFLRLSRQRDPSRTTMIIFYVRNAVQVLIYYFSGAD
jgi:hypothetical protein